MVKKETVEKWGLDNVKVILADDGKTVKKIYCAVCREPSEKTARFSRGLKGACSELVDKWILGTENIKKM